METVIHLLVGFGLSGVLWIVLALLKPVQATPEGSVKVTPPDESRSNEKAADMDANAPRVPSDTANGDALRKWARDAQ